ncbi:ADP-ribose 1''-phosphate phosphatase [Epicoccum nigrum]|nr:ADP-ribose 1''-phosphate phosphatase [Epicoccum nigrum]
MSGQQNASSAAGPRGTATSKLKRPSSDLPPPAKKPKTDIAHVRQHLDYGNVPANWLDASAQPSTDQPCLQFIYHKGDMLADAPEDCLLVHACNTQGVWGSGIAKAFKEQYRKAYAAHRIYCTKEHNIANPVRTGTAQLLAPCDDNEQHWIGCLFTSAKYGKNKDKPDQILKNTGRSMQMLLELVSQVDAKVSNIRMCKINSGRFGVPWEKTEEVIKGIALKPHWRTEIEIWEPEEESQAATEMHSEGKQHAQ